MGWSNNFCPLGATVHVGINPSKVQITKLKLDKDRKALLERRAAPKLKAQDKLAGKVTETKDATMTQLD